MDELGIPTVYGGRDYSKAIEKAIQDASTEYQYPSSASNMGMKRMLGRSFYRQLIEASICEARIPGPLKVQLMGEAKYKDCLRSR